jgi:hypothetical protein
MWKPMVRTWSHLFFRSSINLPPPINNLKNQPSSEVVYEVESVDLHDLIKQIKTTMKISNAKIKPINKNK